jgi:catalase
MTSPSSPFGRAGNVRATVKPGRGSVVEDRIFATARSIEFDTATSPRALPTVDIKFVVMLQEAFRHCKSLGP